VDGHNRHHRHARVGQQRTQSKQHPLHDRWPWPATYGRGGGHHGDLQQAGDPLAGLAVTGRPNRVSKNVSVSSAGVNPSAHRRRCRRGCPTDAGYQPDNDALAWADDPFDLAGAKPQHARADLEAFLLVEVEVLGGGEAMWGGPAGLSGPAGRESAAVVRKVICSPVIGLAMTWPGWAMADSSLWPIRLERRGWRWLSRRRH
jgi:hypothetical protein